MLSFAMCTHLLFRLLPCRTVYVRPCIIVYCLVELSMSESGIFSIAVAVIILDTTMIECVHDSLVRLFRVGIVV